MFGTYLDSLTGLNLSVSCVYSCVYRIGWASVLGTSVSVEYS